MDENKQKIIESKIRGTMAALEKIISGHITHPQKLMR